MKLSITGSSVLRVALVGSASIATMLATTTGASASATGVAYWGATVVKGVPIPSGQLTHVIDGKGAHVNTDGANFVAASQLCQWWIDFDYYNGKGVRWDHIQGVRHDSCNREGTVGYTLNSKMQTGLACASLYKTVPGGVQRLARQCHNIHN